MFSQAAPNDGRSPWVVKRKQRRPSAISPFPFTSHRLHSTTLGSAFQAVPSHPVRVAEDGLLPASLLGDVALSLAGMTPLVPVHELPWTHGHASLSTLVPGPHPPGAFHPIYPRPALPGMAYQSRHQQLPHPGLLHTGAAQGPQSSLYEAFLSHSAEAFPRVSAPLPMREASAFSQVYPRVPSAPLAAAPFGGVPSLELFRQRGEVGRQRQEEGRRVPRVTSKRRWGARASEEDHSTATPILSSLAAQRMRVEQMQVVAPPRNSAYGRKSWVPANNVGRHKHWFDVDQQSPCSSPTTPQLLSDVFLEVMVRQQQQQQQQLSDNQWQARRGPQAGCQDDVETLSTKMSGSPPPLMTIPSSEELSVGKDAGGNDKKRIRLFGVNI